jgi:hypothetical protein
MKCSTAKLEEDDDEETEEMIHATAAERFPAPVDKPVSGDRLKFR